MYYQDFRPMKSEGIRTIRRPGQEHAGERSGHVPPGVDFEDFPAAAMKPCDNDNIVADLHSMKSNSKCREYFQKSVRRSLRVESGGVFSFFEFRTNDTDGYN